MSVETKVYVSVDGAAGHLVINGPMILLRELLGSFAEHPATAPASPVPAAPPEAPDGRQ